MQASMAWIKCMRVKIFALVMVSLLFIPACAHRENVSTEQFDTLNKELKICRSKKDSLEKENNVLKKKLGDSCSEIEKLKSKIESYQMENQALLDKNIKSLEDNKMLLKEISSFQDIMQERSERALRLNKLYKYIVSCLKEERLSGKVIIVKLNDKLKIIIPRRSLFPTERSAWVTPRGNRLLNKIASCIKTMKPGYIEISGHTDNAPITKGHKMLYPTKWHLGLSRAIAVVTRFEKMGIKSDNMCAISYAGTRPLAESPTPGGMSMNNRVEIVITP